MTNDVALLKLATPVTNVPVIPLVTSTSQFATSMPCKGMGFGLTSDGGSPSAILLQVDMNFISQSIAKLCLWRHHGRPCGCGDSGGRAGYLPGDSGGPLVVADGKGGWLMLGWLVSEMVAPKSACRDLR